MKKANIELLRKYSKEINIAEFLDENELNKIGKKVVEEAKQDDLTRSEWFDKYNEALKIAKQTIETKSYPFEKSSNVKIPLILIGCVQFNSRILPEIIQMGKAVQVEIAGQTTSELEQRAKRLSDHMSLQTVKSNWNTDTDRLLMVLPLVGTVFRKWIYDPIDRKPTSFLCLPTEIIVDNDVSSLDNAQRITHVLKQSKNDIIEKIRFGLYNEIDLKELRNDEVGNYQDPNPSHDDEKVLPSELEDSDTNYIIYEQHCYLDLDDDGYKEPYIVTALKHNSKVLRIAARYDENSFVFNAKKELIKINPKNYFAAHIFLPSPDGTFLGVGFGQLLLQISIAADSITNNLIDAGTLANIKGGFISKDLRLQKGDLDFNPGEWKIVNNTIGQSLQNNIFPLPVSEPSQTLMALLQFLIDFGKQVANINDILMGSPEAANMPATSVVALVEQGTKIYNSILNRLFESFRQEFNILFNLNKTYFNLYPKKDVYTSTGFVTQEDYTNEAFNVIPVANPSLGTDAVRLAKMQALLQLSQDPLINRQEIYKRYFDVLGISDSQKLFAPPPPPQPPSPDDVLKGAQAKYLGMQTAEIQMKAELEALKLMVQEKEAQADAAYKASQIANQRLQNISDVAKTEAITSSQDMAKATNLVDAESKKSTTGIDYGDVLAETQQELQQNQLQFGQQSAYNQQVGAGQAQAPGQQMPVGQKTPQLSPELDAALKNLGQQEQAPASPEGVVGAGEIK